MYITDGLQCEDKLCTTETFHFMLANKNNAILANHTKITKTHTNATL